MLYGYQPHKQMTPLGPMTAWHPRRGSTFGVAPPPGPIGEWQERNAIRWMQLHGNRQADEFARFLHEDGDQKIWWNFARQYRQASPLVAGWVGTGLMGVAMGVAALQNWMVKRHYRRPRPYQVDPSIVPIAGLEKSQSYPSGHAAASSAAATVLSVLWPLRGAEFQWWANQVAQSRVYGGVHYPSDAMVGAQLGQRTALGMMSLVR